MSSHRILAAVLSFAVAGCTHSSFDRARREDTPEAYRRFLRENGDGDAAIAARNRLGELEFQAARREHTVLAYKRFLEEFPGSARASDAEILLEGLRFEAAKAADTSAAWNEFLRDHAAGPHAADARRALDDADFRDAKAAEGARPMAEFLARHPDSPHRAEAEGIADDRLFAELVAQGPRGLVSYLARSAAGRHRDEARALLQSREALAHAAVGDFARARRAAELVTDAQARAELLGGVAREELEWATAQLDPRALEAFAIQHDGDLAAEARRRAAALGRERALKELQQIVARLDPLHYARPADELQKVLAAADPRERWLAAEELGLMGARGAVDALLDAVATAHFSRVRQRAFEALQALFAVMPADTVDLQVRERIEALRKVANTPALHVKLAVLEELTGDTRAAADDYARAQRGDGADLFVLRRLANLRVQRGESFSAAVAARELATRVTQLIELRARDEGLSPVLLSRAMCGARDDAQAAVEVLRGLPPSVARDFPEDLPAFLQRARDAERLASAKLADAEAAARAADRQFRGCDDDGELRARMEEGVGGRLRPVEELGARRDKRAGPALRISARLDPSPKVREAAQALLRREAH